MAVLSEIQAGILTQDELVAGVIEEIITVDQMFNVLPFDAINGSALDLSVEDQLGAAGMTTVTGATANTGDFILSDGATPVAANTITANALPANFDADGAVQGANFKSPATFNERTFRLKTILGEADVNGLIQATYSAENDQEETQIASKAKTVGRIFKSCFINGNEAASAGLQFDGLLTLAAANGQTTPVNGNLSFEAIDEGFDEVKDKDGQVDYIVSHARTRRSYKSLLRGVGGATVDDVVTLENGDEVLAYEGVPWFRNDFVPVDGGATGTQGSVIFGTLDDGSRSYGVAGLTASEAAGIRVVAVGERENSDSNLTRVKWYASLANFSRLGLHVLSGIDN